LPNLIGHSQLVVPFGFWTRVPHGALHNGIRCDTTQTGAENMPQVVDRKVRYACAFDVPSNPLEKWSQQAHYCDLIL
jgi:hypothetical protein